MFSFLKTALRKVHDFLVRIYDFLVKTQTEVRIIDFRKVQRIHEPIPIKIDGLIVDKCNNRKVCKIGDSHYVSHPKGWLYSIANEQKVTTYFVSVNDNEQLIVISKPKREGEK